MNEFAPKEAGTSHLVGLPPIRKIIELRAYPVAGPMYFDELIPPSQFFSTRSLPGYRIGFPITSEKSELVMVKWYSHAVPIKRNKGRNEHVPCSSKRNFDNAVVEADHCCRHLGKAFKAHQRQATFVVIWPPGGTVLGKLVRFNSWEAYQLSHFNLRHEDLFVTRRTDKGLEFKSAGPCCWHMNDGSKRNLVLENSGSIHLSMLQSTVRNYWLQGEVEALAKRVINPQG